MLLQSTTGVSTDDKDAEDEQYNENDEERSNEGANKGTFFVIDIKCLRYASVQRNALVKFVYVS